MGPQSHVLFLLVRWAGNHPTGGFLSGDQSNWVHSTAGTLSHRWPVFVFAEMSRFVCRSLVNEPAPRRSLRRSGPEREIQRTRGHSDHAGELRLRHPACECHEPVFSLRPAVGLLDSRTPEKVARRLSRKVCFFWGGGPVAGHHSQEGHVYQRWLKVFPNCSSLPNPSCDKLIKKWKGPLYVIPGNLAGARHKQKHQSIPYRAPPKKIPST